MDVVGVGASADDVGTIISVDLVGALVAATLDPRITAFALALGQSGAFVVAAGVGFWVLHRRHGHLGLRGAAAMFLKLLVPAVLTALALLWAGTLAAGVVWGTELQGALDGGTLEFLPWRYCLWLAAGGMAVGSAGGFIAARHAG